MKKIVFPNFEKVVQIEMSAPSKVKYGSKPMSFIVMLSPQFSCYFPLFVSLSMANQISVDQTSSLM